VSAPIDPTAPDDTAESPPTVGAQLRAGREARGAPLEEASRALRIDVELIEALEADQFEVFSAPVFTKGYVKRYADFLGLPVEEILEAYYAQVGRDDVPVVSPNAPIKLGDDRQKAMWILVVVLLGILGLAAFLWWRSGPDTSSAPQVGAVSLETKTESASAPLPPPVETDPTPPVDTGAALTPAPEAADEEAAPAPEEAQAQDAADLSIELAFNEDCWAEVTDASGERLFYGLGRSGARSRFVAQPPVAVLLGNVNGVDLTVNGAPYAVPVESRQGNLARFVLLEAGA
jgi:cytoskeleton protein RodZ